MKKERKRATKKGNSKLQRPFSVLPSLSTLLRDRRGTVAAQTFVLLPIFVLVVLGGYEFLSAMSVKHALHNGTYQAVRYLALNPITDRNPRVWEEVAETLVVQELTAAMGKEAAHRVHVEVIPPSMVPPCYFSERFSVIVTLLWSPEVPFADRLAPINMKEEYRNQYFVCH